MTKFATVLLASALTFTLAACNSGGDGNGNSTGSGTDSGTSVSQGVVGYIVETAELDANAHPENYPLIASNDFEAAFAELKAANLARELTDYQSVATVFGVDGAYYVNNDRDIDGDIYKYYGWYSDAGTSVIITFKAKGEELTYKAYTGNKIS